MVEQIRVRFQGDGAGEGELSWGQRELWGAMRSKRTWMPMGAVAPLPPGTTVAEVVADLRFVMCRYPTLRTRLRIEPDTTRQVVAAAGEVVLEVIDAAPGADPAEVAARVLRRYWDTDYDVTTEWPVRMGVVRHRGVPTHRVWVNCHLVTDATGAAIMVDALAERRAAARGSATAPPREIPPGLDPMPPLAQARWQASPAGQRQCARVLRYWERWLENIPATRFPRPARRAGPRYWNGRFTSPALRLAVPVIAARTGVETSTVLLALFALALWRVTGADPVVTKVVVSNRFRRDLAGTASPIVHNGLCVLEVAGLSLTGAVAHTRGRTLAAYTHAYYDPPRLDALIERIGRRRGRPVELGCFFNDRRRAGAAVAPGLPAGPERIRAAVGASGFGWDDRQDHSPCDPLFLSVDDRPGGLSLEIFIDAYHLSPEAAEACARRMEAIAVAAGTAADVTAAGATRSAGP